jgi:dihydroorotate dehydrogenase (NAD+) catalytic subunit
MISNRQNKSARPDLTTFLGPLTLKNPITVASGTFGYGLEYQNYVDLNHLGAIFVKGLTLKPTFGHPQQRIAETPSGMLNCIGLQNVGVDSFINEKLPLLREYDTAVIANINGSTLDDYVRITERLSSVDGIAALEVNVSCPNVSAGGMLFGTDSHMIETVTREVKSRTGLPVIVKLSPNVTDIRVMARAAENGGADIISLINTLVGIAINCETRKPVLSNVTGGLSGPAIKPVALRCVLDVSKSVSLPIIGMGGINSGIDAIEFFLAGSHAVSIGTANFVHPDASIQVLDEVEQYMISHDIFNLGDLVGGLILDDPPSTSPSNQKKE